MFERIEELVAGMTAESRRSVPSLNNWEFARRMRQLEHFYEEAVSYAKAAAHAATLPAVDHEAATELAITYAEAFYLFAWRVRVSLTRGAPLGPFDPTGISRVRNLSIEHPEHGGPPLPSWAVSGNGDIRLASVAGGRTTPTLPAGAPHRDPGLLANAAEFKLGLEALLERHQRVNAEDSEGR